MEVWLASADSNAEALRRALEKELTAVGISAVLEKPPDSPGLLAFNALSPEALHSIREISQNGRRRVIVTTAEPISDSDTWAVLHAGASDAIYWKGGGSAERIVARLNRWAEVDRLLASPAVSQNLIGKSRVWLNCLRQAIEAARFSSAPVMLMGDTGTGKELVARLIHTLDPRPNKRDLILVDCTTIIRDLSGSEFFGHERGAYTGAAGPREGAFALAAGGTLFLDEVGELELKLQAQLLRVIQEKTYKPVGGNAWRKAEFRLVCATNRDLRVEVERGNFRADLYYRIASCICYTPPLSSRREDIPLLARRFAAELHVTEPPPALDDALERYFLTREFPGNVRDLRQLVTRMMMRYTGAGPLTLADIPEDERPAPGDASASWRGPEFDDAIRKACMLGAGLKEIGREAEAAAIRIIMAEENGKISRAASRLGVTERALQLRRSAQRGAA